jgi:ABC-type branched-subunit amino acid transport system permease subunit
LGGIAHAFVFPAAMADGSLAFPMRYRGLATTLMLTVFDLGSLIGQPAVGSVIKLAQFMGWPAYPLMYVSVALLLLLVLAIYVWSTSASGGLPRKSRKDGLDTADLALR